MQKTHQPTHRKVLLGLISLAAIFALMLGGSGTQVALAQAGGASTPATVIPHPHHSYKHVCNPTNVPGMNHCDLDVITDANGKALVLANSLVSPQTLASVPYGPAQLRGAYGESGTTSKTRTVAIVDAYNDATVLSDLNTFSSTYSIPTMSSCAVSGGTYSSPCFQVVNETGGPTLPPSDGLGVNGWAGEISLDVQAVHAMCQNCNILLIEATTPSNYDLIAEADQTAVNMGANVVSNSWGGSEDPSETSIDSYFNHPGIPFVFSSGDGAYGTQYPAASPNVTSVGGTSLNVNSDNTYNSETVWFWDSTDGAGSGCSAYEPKPYFQHDSGCSNRTVADVSADADPDTGLSVYVTDPVNGTGFYGFGGTSLSAPLVSAVYALAGGVGTTLGNSLPYANVNYGVNLRDVTSGYNGSCSPDYLCTAETGYDGPTGLGTPLGTAAFTPSYTTINVSIGGTSQGAYGLPSQGSKRPSYAGVNNGPVAVQSSGGVPIIASERVAYSNGSAWTSFAELMGLPSNQLTNTYVMPWYNNVDLNSQLRFGNVGSSSTTVTVYVAGVAKGSYTLAPSQSTRVSYTGLNNGPVVVQSSGNVPIIASERVAYSPDGGTTWTSFSELMGLPSYQLTNTYVMPWYNNVDLNSQLRFGNVGSSSTTIYVTVAGVAKGSYTLAPNQSTRVSYVGLNNGPVVVQSSGGVPIIASERVAYSPDGGTTWTSFSELMGLPNYQITTAYVMPIYDNVGVNDQLRFGNVGSSSTTVTVKVGGVVQGSYTLAPSQSTRISYTGLSNGPVVIQSSGSVPIIASKRVAYSPDGGTTWTSFAEMMGLPASQLSTTYVLPWYNDVDLNSQLRFAVP